MKRLVTLFYELILFGTGNAVSSQSFHLGKFIHLSYFKGWEVSGSHLSFLSPQFLSHLSLFTSFQAFPYAAKASAFTVLALRTAHLDAVCCAYQFAVVLLIAALTALTALTALLHFA